MSAPAQSIVADTTEIGETQAWLAEWAEAIYAVIDPASNSESGRIGSLNPQSVLKT